MNRQRFINVWFVFFWMIGMLSGAGELQQPELVLSESGQYVLGKFPAGAVVFMIDDTNATDISAATGIQADYVNIAFSKVSDLSPLKGMQITVLMAQRSKISDLSPLEGMSTLRWLGIWDTEVQDISPLKNLKLERLSITRTTVKDISFLVGMPLRVLTMNDTQVDDLSSLAGMSLNILSLWRTPVTDLSPLKGMMSLKTLGIIKTGITDLSPLAGMELREIFFSPDRIKKGMNVLREMKSLEVINWEQSPAMFWDKYDRGVFSSSETTKKENSKGVFTTKRDQP